MSKTEQRLDKLLPEVSVKEKAKLFLVFKNTHESTRESGHLQNEAILQEYSRIYDSIQGKDVSLIRRQQKEFKYLTNLIFETEKWLREGLHEMRLVLVGLAPAVEAIALQGRVNFVMRHAINLLSEGENLYGQIKRPITQEEWDRLKAEEEQAVLPLDELLDVMVDDWCEEQGYKPVPLPPMEAGDVFLDDPDWKERDRKWRSQGYGAFRELFPSQEEYRKWAEEIDYTSCFVVPDAVYQAKRDDLEREIRKLISDGVLASGTCSQTQQEGVITKSWFDHLKAKGLAKNDYFFGKYLCEDRYRAASPEEVEQWQKATEEQIGWFRKLSSEKKGGGDSNSEAGELSFWGGRTDHFLEETVAKVNDQLCGWALQQAVPEYLSKKHFDGAILIPPRLEDSRKSLKDLLDLLVEMLAGCVKTPWLTEKKVAPPSAVSAQEEDVQRLLRSIEDAAMISMLEWAGERDLALRLLDARQQETTNSV